MNTDDARKFYAACLAWRDEKGSAKRAKQFAVLLSEALSVLDVTSTDLVKQFEVAESTILRWAKGLTSPHPLIQKQVISDLQTRAYDAMFNPIPFG